MKLSPYKISRAFVRRWFPGRGSWAALLFLGLASAVPAQPSAANASAAETAAAWTEFRQHVQPFLAKYCYECHGGQLAENDVRFDGIRDQGSLKKSGDILEKALKNLARHKMPPADEPQPPAAEAAGVVTWLKTYFAGDASTPINPGRVTLRRLNRAEYNNTLRDLLGIDLRLADNFPADEASFGFDNNGDVLSLAPLLMEKYFTAATRAIGAARAANRLDRLPANTPKRDAAEKSIRSFAARAYRRPVTDDEVAPLMALWTRADADGRAFEQSLDVVLQAVLVSPPFLFRIELEPQPGEAGDVHTLSGYELATRLSYFLWSSMPDDELFALAANGTLRENLGLQVRRMLKDRKSAALVENFAGQWLQLRAMRNVAPDATLFPDFDQPLRVAMMLETALFFKAIMYEDRSVLDFIDAGFTFLNARLAKHYGIPGISGEDFRRVELTGNQRAGVLTHASILTLTSQPGRTSPVQRGKWVLENFLGTPPPPPPPNVPLLTEEKGELKGTLRQRMEQHRADPNCAGCHARMDGIGFALENFDAVGAWRTEERGEKIDASGTLPGGKQFTGPEELRRIIKSQSDEFVDCLVGRMLTFALGRGLEPYDRRTTDRITEAMQHNGYRFSVLVEEIARSDAFQKRNGRQTQEKL